MKLALALILGSIVCIFVTREMIWETKSVESNTNEEEKIPPVLTDEQQALRQKLRAQARIEQNEVNERLPRVPLDDVGPNIRVNQSGTGTVQAEFAITASISHPNTLLAGAVDFRGTNGQLPQVGFYTSLDGGDTWRDALRTFGPPDGLNQLAGDPVVCIDADGRMYVAYISFFGGLETLYVQTSDDNGVTWTDPLAVAVDRVDKPYACIDVNPESLFYGYYYIFWTQSGGPLKESHSNNGGETFSPPRQISPTGIHALFCSPTCGPNGEVYVCWMNYSANTNIMFDRSLDGGAHWAGNTTLGSYTAVNSTPCAQSVFRYYNYPVLACDISSGPRRGWLYLSWTDGVNEELDLLFKRSENGGTTWSTASHIEDDATNQWQAFHWMSVHPVNGQIGVSWLDWRDGNCSYRCYGAVSSNGGTSWEPNFPISTSASNPAGLSFIGDYNGNTFGRDGRFIAVWMDMSEDDGDLYSAWFEVRDNTLDAPTITILRNENHMQLNWQPVPGVPFYRIYSGFSTGGPYDYYEGVTTSNHFLDSNALSSTKKFYVVVSSMEP